MLSIETQIEKGCLVCPKTHQKLKWSEDKKMLVSSDRKHKYPVENGVPILLKDAGEIKKEWKDSNMETEYEKLKGKKKFKQKVREYLEDDLRAEKAAEGFKLFDKYDDGLCIAIGGGPKRHHKNLVNLNMAPFVNIDVVGDAHHLPYADDCVEAIHCEAVLEHLPEPHKAIQEMYRVLKKGGVVYSITPFLQAYHGYPHHYQNLTLTGHEYYYKKQGFEIKESGVCAGPTYTVIMLNYLYLLSYLPRILSLVAKIYFVVGMGIFKHFDRILNKKKEAHNLACTTLVVAEK